MIRFNDFQAQWGQVEKEVRVAVDRTLASGWYLLGKELANFETELASWLGVDHAVGVANGTEALAVALMAMGIGPGDEVIAPALTAYPTVTGIAMTGATPVIVDVKGGDATLDSDGLTAALSPKTRAVVPVHLYGRCADMDAINTFAEAHGLNVLEDCAQAMGAARSGRLAGTMGTAAAFSFYPTKNLGAFGDAGAVVTGDPELAERMRATRVYGQVRPYCHDMKGINSRMDEIQAAVLRAKLPHLAGWNSRRREFAARYYRALPNLEFMGRPKDGREATDHVHHLFVIRVENREQFMADLRADGVETLIHYPIPVHRQKAFSGRWVGELPQSIALASEVVSLPLHPWLTDEHQDAVIAAVQKRIG